MENRQQGLKEDRTNKAMGIKSHSGHISTASSLLLHCHLLESREMSGNIQVRFWSQTRGKSSGVQTRCLVPAILHEDQVPDLHYIRAALVHQCRSISATAHVVIVDLCAGTTGTCVPHLPEVVLQWKRKHVTGRHPGKANNRGSSAGAHTQSTC